MSTSIEDAREFIRTHHRGVLATLRRDGRPQMSPVLVAVDDDDALIISTRETALKTKNLRRRNWASVCVFNDAFFGSWVQAEGTATVESLPRAMESLVRYYRLVSGEHPDWDDYREAMRRERRVVLIISIERAGPSRAG